MLTGILFGLVPALQISRPDVQESIRETGRGTSGSRRQSRFRQALIVGEVALCVVLLAGAGLLFRSFIHLQSVNAGFVAEQVLTARVTPSGANFTEDATYVNFYNQVMERVRSVPGVVDVGMINTLPLAKGPTGGFRVEGREVTTPDKWPGANVRSISADYFRAMSVPIVKGRAFTEHDKEGAPRVLIVNQALAQTVFPVRTRSERESLLETRTRTISRSGGRLLASPQMCVVSSFAKNLSKNSTSQIRKILTETCRS